MYLTWIKQFLRSINCIFKFLSDKHKIHFHIRSELYEDDNISKRWLFEIGSFQKCSASKLASAFNSHSISSFIFNGFF